MGLITNVVFFPVGCMKGVLLLARLLEEEARRHQANPTNVRGDLERIEEARAEGEISEGRAAQKEEALIDELVEPQNPRKAPT
jgi:hypothetical protein